MKKIITLLVVSVFILLSSYFFTNTKDNEITIYTAQESDYIDYFLEDFKKKHPEIKLNVIKESTGTVTAKLLVEKNNPKADVIWNVGLSSFLELDQEGVLMPYNPSSLEHIDSRFYDTTSENPKWIGTTAWGGVMTVNTKEAEKKGVPIPNSFSDLKDPIYKDEIVMPDPTASATGFLLLSGWLQSGEGDIDWSYMDEIDKNVKQYTASGSAPIRTTGMGEQVIGLGTDKESLNLEKKVPEIITIFPKEEMIWDLEAVALVNKENIKPEAEIFYEWAISEDAIKLYGENRTMTTLKDEGPLMEGMPEDTKETMKTNDFEWASKYRKDVTIEWIRRYSN